MSPDLTAPCRADRIVRLRQLARAMGLVVSETEAPTWEPDTEGDCWVMYVEGAPEGRFFAVPASASFDAALTACELAAGIGRTP